MAYDRSEVLGSRDAGRLLGHLSGIDDPDRGYIIEALIQVIAEAGLTDRAIAEIDELYPTETEQLQKVSV